MFPRPCAVQYIFDRPLMSCTHSTLQCNAKHDLASASVVTSNGDSFTHRQIGKHKLAVSLGEGMDKLCSHVSDLEGGSGCGRRSASSVFLSECICNPILGEEAKKSKSLLFESDLPLPSDIPGLKSGP